MRKYISTTCLLLIFATAFSQEQNVLEGLIRADSLEDSKINIINVTQRTGTTNSADGAFSIEVKENDTLLFSSVQYEEVSIEISKKHLTEKFLEVTLLKKVIDLKEVAVSNISLTGNLAQDIEQIEMYDLYEGIPTSKLPRLTSIGRKLYTARDGDIDPLLNYLSGRTQMLEKAIENEEVTRDVQKGIDVFELTFFTQELEIPEEEIINFVYYCAESSSYRQLIANNNYLDLIELMEEKAPEFRELRKSERAPLVE